MTPRSRRPASSASLEAELGAQHLVGVLADPRHPGLGTLGHLRQLHRVAGHEHGLVDAVGARHLDEHVPRRDVRVGDHVGRVVARARDDARRGELARRFELRALRRPRLDRGPDHRLEVRRPTRRASRSAGRRSTRDDRRARRASRTGARARSARRRSRRTRGSPRRSPASALSGSGRTPIDQKLVTTSVIATIASNIAMSTYWPSPVWSRWRSAARMPMTPNSAELMSPSAPTGIVTGGSSGWR